MLNFPVTFTPEYTMDLILEALRELVEYELAVVLSMEDESTLKVSRARGPLYSRVLDGFQIDLEARKDIARILRGGKPYLFAESEEHTDTYHGILELPDGHSCLVSPLYSRDTPIGLLTLDHRSCGKFTPEIVRFIQTLSKLISMNLIQCRTSEFLTSQNEDLIRERNSLLDSSHPALENLLGTSGSWSRVLDHIRLVAGSDTPVLLLGETGTGKEAAARALHSLSLRSRGPFVAVNCSALTDSLAESELFGHEQGAFTGAAGRRRGLFELADGGTLFLDEIGELPLSLQPKILRTLQEGEYQRVGGEKTLKTDIRIIAATNRNLRDEVREGGFRSDLFYRLAVFPITLPPLRERERDAVHLARHFLSRLKTRFDLPGAEFSPGALTFLEGHPWPGNVRELQNAVERGILLARGGLILPEHLLEEGSPALLLPAAGNLREEEVLTLEELERRHIRAVLKRTGGRLYGSGGAAELLGLKPTTLQSRMKKLGLSRS